MLKPLRDGLDAWMPSENDLATDPLVILGAGWSEIVGEEIARNTHPLRIADGTLLVTTRSSAWSQQLSFLADRIVEAIRARVPRAGIEQLRFRVGQIPIASERRRGEFRRVATPRRASPRPPTGTTEEAMARFQADVTARQRAKAASGWKQCTGCGVLIAPADPALCVPCESAREQRLATAAAQVLFEAPWLGYSGTSALVEGLKREEYDTIRARLLARWWETLVRARAAKRLSRDGHERLIASSYVVLKSQLPPEQIVPATVRSVLGDELHDLIYKNGTA